MSMAPRYAGNRTRVPRVHEPAVAGARTVTGPVEDTLLLSEVEQPRPVEAQPEWADRAVLGGAAGVASDRPHPCK
jgi:hypothetical protein